MAFESLLKFHLSKSRKPKIVRHITKSMYLKVFRSVKLYYRNLHKQSVIKSSAFP